MPRNYRRKEGDKAGMYLEDIGGLHNNDKLSVEQNHQAAHHNYARHEEEEGWGSWRRKGRSPMSKSSPVILSCSPFGQGAAAPGVVQRYMRTCIRIVRYAKTTAGTGNTTPLNQVK
ncbi:hypothetical protein ASPBRDRAFT_73270 [Aspergillus brasiliensis CBS 101740]|uniref:Uncharacterized protein n=1 Tax=Aspergillus brasiliensis (strain CBS 101740 / IMI 381727 / IBT 21946) TaxID=767769 RepID=A0A1L9UTT3_ASPBC|nr:hypothetical protein ASPBRDRAFT_73270 [Aspergillus brasiliensis CBS 101740]